jgi:hypothetical protein
MKYSFPNPGGNVWIDKYNALVDEVAKNEDHYKEMKKTQPKRDDKNPSAWSGKSIGIHHIIPKKINPDLTRDKNNLLYVTIEEHCWLHYYLWRADSQYAKHFWFLLQAVRKWGWWTLPGGEAEYEEIKKDVAKGRKEKEE